MTKEERRRIEAQRKHTRIKLAKAVLIGTMAVAMPLLFFLVTQR